MDIRRRQEQVRRIFEPVLQPIYSHADVAEPTRPPSAARTPGTLIPAAVLVPLVVGVESIDVLLTVRTGHLKSHAGQVSFPGGQVEPGDRDVAATALRETREELGVMPEDVRTLGCLQPCVTGTGFNVIPVVGLVPPKHRYDIDQNEVSEVFHAPLAFLVDPANHGETTRQVDGRTVTYVSIRYRDYDIWGATARMIVDFSRLLRASRQYAVLRSATARV